MQIKRIIAVLLCVAVLASAINLVGAQTGSIWTTATASSTDYESEFVVGETVYIYWSVSGPVSISVFNNIGGLVATVGTGLTDQPATWVIPQGLTPGTYYILIPGAGYFPIAVASVHIVPESVLGTVMATVAGFAAFGIVGLIKFKKTRPSYTKKLF